MDAPRRPFRHLPTLAWWTCSLSVVALQHQTLRRCVVSLPHPSQPPRPSGNGQVRIVHLNLQRAMAALPHVSHLAVRLRVRCYLCFGEFAPAA
ncbi:hypothetical protein M3J09_004398 [Ascochyta lentis]